MAFQIAIRYHDKPVTFNVAMQEEGIYIFRLHGPQRNEEYIPEKLLIRRKGMLWISDQEDQGELVNTLIEEIGNFNSNSVA
jgi:hypothetical protein